MIVISNGFDPNMGFANIGSEMSWVLYELSHHWVSSAKLKHGTEFCWSEGLNYRLD